MEELYKKIFSDIPVKKCSKILSSYDETPLKVLGEITVNVEQLNIRILKKIVY